MDQVVIEHGRNSDGGGAPWLLSIVLRSCCAITSCAGKRKYDPKGLRTYIPNTRTSLHHVVVRKAKSGPEEIEQSTCGSCCHSEQWSRLAMKRRHVRDAITEPRFEMALDISTLFVGVMPSKYAKVFPPKTFESQRTLPQRPSL